MKRKYPHLCSPIRVGNLTLRNRMLSAPMATPYITQDGLLTWEASAFYEKRAKGGAAVVTVSEGVTHPATGQNYSRQIVLAGEDCLTMLTETAKSIKRHGAIASMEIGHGGKRAETDIEKGYKSKLVVKYGPSAELEQNGIVVKEMPKKMIQDIIESYGKGAELIKRAGFDMLLVHGGHGWLIHQFLSPVDNRRTDEYGGDIKNRCRLACDILDCIRAHVGLDFPIEFRLSAEECIEGGYTLKEGIEYAKLIEDKIDLLQVSVGSHDDAFAYTHLPMFAKRGANVHYAAEIKKHVKVPVATLGALNNPSMMDKIIASGKADVVEMARALIADPELPNKILEGRDREIQHCIRCFDCFASRIESRTRICAINPVIGREFEKPEPVSQKKKVMIAGGGPAGMEAAIVAAKRGHEVVLCEKNSHLGGALHSVRKIPFMADINLLIRTKTRELYLANVDVRLNTKVTAEYVEAECPDVLIIAVGAEPKTPKLPDITGSNVVFANNICDDDIQIGQRVIILGGGMIGSYIAIYLAQNNKDVTIVEKANQLAKDANVVQRLIILDMLYRHGVKLMTETIGTELTSEGFKCISKDRTKRILIADTVVCATGYRSRIEVVDSLRDGALIVKTVGDCVEPKNIYNAIWTGYHAGMDI